MQYIYHSFDSDSEHYNMDDLDFDVGLDLRKRKDDGFFSRLTPSSSSSSLYQLEQSFLRGLPSMAATVTTITTTTVTTTTTTTDLPTPTSSNTTTNASAPLSAEKWAIAAANDYYPEDQHHYEQEEDCIFLPKPTVSEGPYLFAFDFWVSLYYPIRALILFILGFAFSLVTDNLQTQHNLIKYPSNIHQIWDTASWLPPTCGLSAILIGTLYALGDYLRWGRRIERNSNDLSGVIRCIGGFIGINYAASKFPWTSGIQATLTLAMISIVLWYWFDRTLQGFLISSTVALVGTMVTYFLVLNGWYSLTRADFFGVGLWIPCILYSSSVCFGSIGRQLDVIPPTWYSSNAM